MPNITYYCDTEKKLVVDYQTGDTILEVSLKNNIPHYHACYGNARCTTCRIQVLQGKQNLTPRTPAEQKVAQEKNWPEEIRLACQTEILGEVTIRQLVTESTQANSNSVGDSLVNMGYERSLVIMFCDVVNFTNFVSLHLPYDVVYLLNRYYKEICEPILAHQGYIDKYMGDGIMVVFGLEEIDPVKNCLNAVQASLQMYERVKDLNRHTVKDFSYEFNMRTGLHYGLVIVGEIGHPSKRQLTVLGDAVNVASRIEAANKEFGTKILASQEILDHIHSAIETGKVVETQLRGQNRLHRLYEIIGLKK
jgi:adenylate cyclase